MAAPVLRHLALPACPLCNLVLGGPKTSSNQNQLPDPFCFPRLPSPRLCSVHGSAGRQLFSIPFWSTAMALQERAALQVTALARLLCSGTERCRAIHCSDARWPQLRTSL